MPFLVKLSTLIFVLLPLIEIRRAFADIQFCLNGRQKLQTLKSSNRSLHCPYGLLFKEPVAITATADPDYQFCFGETICTTDSWKCTNKLQYAKAQFILPFKTRTQKNLESLDGDEQISMDIPLCKSLDPNNDLNYEDSILTKSEPKRRVKRQAKIASNPTLNVKKKQADRAVQAVIDDQTKRLFYFITGINIEDVSSHLRVTKLFHSSVRLVLMICDPLFLKEEFLDNVEQGFMFLLKQQGLEKLTDVDADDFAMLQRALDYCMGDPDATVFIDGNHCPADFYIESLRRKKVQMPFDRTDESNFVWGKYDVIVDAAWHIIDIVHGMCFATFKENLNLHHKFQVVMEQLFHDALHLRWNSVTKFLREDRLDNVFTVSVNSSMEVLDGCAQGAYIGSPFLHRLQRPELNTRARKKRSITLREDIETKNLHDMAYCLQSSDEVLEKTRELQEKQCSGIMRDDNAL